VGEGDVPAPRKDIAIKQPAQNRWSHRKVLAFS